MPAAPHPADIHAGAPAERVIADLVGAFGTVTRALAELELRPTTVEVHRQLDLVDVAVYFPHADTASVDTLADHFRLPPALGGGALYYRHGLAELGDADAFSLAVRSTRPGVDLGPLTTAAPIDDPVVITGGLAAVPAALPAGRDRLALVIP